MERPIDFLLGPYSSALSEACSKVAHRWYLTTMSSSVPSVTRSPEWCEYAAHPQYIFEHRRGALLMAPGGATTSIFKNRPLSFGMFNPSQARVRGYAFACACA
jgi:hypothetical protein